MAFLVLGIMSDFLNDILDTLVIMLGDSGSYLSLFGFIMYVWHTFVGFSSYEREAEGQAEGQRI